ncbi:sigma-54 interaction domain-containing protein [Clostridium omnivorum]|uniref:Sigma-54-dependent Fis family transcriptional regulator n=1 Tax=Clostridium omnivorum TaxID=1604902 RepID=A0ABQ5N2G0_9CLOT|nr:sigma 54-interacting transcriptional regulator [Clostridium sp. E14]GLC29393.1 sigma-54-dependent Fis family transcriptional regulator [Clostridium sp. E14]
MFGEITYDIFDKLEEGIFIVDKEGIIVFMNVKASEIERIDRDAAVGKYLLDLYPTLSEKTSTLLKVLKYREPISDTIQTYRNYKGEELTTVNSSHPIYDGKKLIGAMEIMKDVTSIKKLSEEVIELKEEIHHVKTAKPNKGTAKYDFIDIIGKSEELLKCKEKAAKAGNTTSPILIYGETGTGKELFVQAIHNNSNRRNMPFIAQNCAAIPSTLLEGILFGTSKGSFTGAEDKRGLLELANGGTFYLDELNSMPLELQAKLLRVIQEGALRRVGDNQLRKIDIRIIASVNEPPEELLNSNTIRRDLYYRLNVVRIDIPPLRKRKEDIPVLVNHFINKFNNKFHAKVQGITKLALDMIITGEWQGNIRELENYIEGIFNRRAAGFIDIEDLDEMNLQEVNLNKIIPLKEKLNELEESYIKEALVITQNNISKAAKLLDIPRQTLQYKIKKLQEKKLD